MKQKILMIFVLSLSISVCKAQDNTTKILTSIIDEILVYSSSGNKLCLGELSGSITLFLCVDETGVDKYFSIFGIKLYENSDTVLMYHHPPLDTTLTSPIWGGWPIMIEDFPEDVQYYYPFIAEYVFTLTVKFRNREKFETSCPWVHFEVGCD
ncbi:hypothetical protein FACS1894178_9330 [Bacteroidia bacterium]|nr:hypothetical protein FACS1894178_9330 [Bacteroidia bacterium]